MDESATAQRIYLIGAGAIARYHAKAITGAGERAGRLQFRLHSGNLRLRRDGKAAIGGAGGRGTCVILNAVSQYPSALSARVIGHG